MWRRVAPLSELQTCRTASEELRAAPCQVSAGLEAGGLAGGLGTAFPAATVEAAENRAQDLRVRVVGLPPNRSLHGAYRIQAVDNCVAKLRLSGPQVPLQPPRRQKGSQSPDPGTRCPYCLTWGRRPMDAGSPEDPPLAPAFNSRPGDVASQGSTSRKSSS